ncbi:MAG: tetratricopeptide repeat protein [bacterium]|nr:tetratricopeptide repeat protein [bacterium]
MKHLLLLSLLLSSHCFGQTGEQRAKIDSLKSVIKNAKNDTTIIRCLREWDDIIYKTDPDLDLELNLRMDSLASKNLTRKNTKAERDFYLKQKGRSCANLGIIYNERGQNTIALEYLNASLEAKKELGDKKLIARTLNNIGAIYHEQGIYEKAVDYYMRALNLHKSIGNSRGVAGALNNLAIINKLQENFDTAVEYYERSLELKLKEDDSMAIANAYINLGILYTEMDKFDKGETYTRKCLEISEKINHQKNIAVAYITLGSINYEQNQFEQALSYYLKGFEIQKRTDDRKKIAETAVYLSEVYYELNNLRKARDYGEQGLKLSYDNDVADVTKQATEILYQVYQRLGNYKKAFEMLQQYMKINEKLNNEENRKAVIRQEFTYQYQKKVAADSVKAAEAERVNQALLAEERAKKQQHKLEAEKQAQQKYYVFGGLALMLLFAGFIYNRFLVTRKQKGIIEEQKKKVDAAFVELDKEKKKSDDLLLNILPEEVAEELKREGKAAPMNFEQVTVLFTDFKGFTKIAAEMTPRELVKTLNECFSAFDTIVEKHNMEKIKTIGDAYMCAGGVPIKNGTNPIDAVKAACDMILWVENWNQKRQKKGLSTWEIRIGIHTGELVAGVIGSKKFAFDVWGDAVNVASRIESAGEAGKINISSSTQELVKDHFETEYRGEIEVKNRGAISMYFVKIPE